MSRRRYRMPSMTSLIAFECAARLCNFSRASVELNTSQPAISRHVRRLEEQLGISLFARQGKQISLTEQGRYFNDAVIGGLDAIDAAMDAVKSVEIVNHFIIACSHEISHLYVMPRFDVLQEAVGPDTEVRILTLEYDHQETLGGDEFDMRLAFRSSRNVPAKSRLLFGEDAVPVCSPAFLERHLDVLSAPPEHWQGLPLLELSKPNLGWMDWTQWSHAHASPVGKSAEFRRLNNYVYLLEAAVEGKGLALGWAGLVDRYLENGTLVAIPATRVQTGGGLYAILSPDNRRQDVVSGALKALT